MIRATHSDGRSVRRGTLAVDSEGLTLESCGTPPADPLHIPAGAIHRASVEERVSYWSAVPRQRVRVDLTDGAVHWFVVSHPDATVALVEAVTADPASHPAVIERRRRDAGRRSPPRAAPIAAARGGTGGHRARDASARSGPGPRRRRAAPGGGGADGCPRPGRAGEASTASAVAVILPGRDGDHVRNRMAVSRAGHPAGHAPSAIPATRSSCSRVAPPAACTARPFATVMR